MKSRYDVIFDGALRYIEHSNDLAASGKFAEAMESFQLALKMLESNHHIESLYRQHGMRRGGHT